MRVFSILSLKNILPELICFLIITIYLNLYSVVYFIFDIYIRVCDMFTIYGIKNCNSMKKAFDALTQQGLTYQFHDYKKQGIDAQTLKLWIDALGADVVLNKKGTTWRKLSEAEQQHALANEDNLIETLTQNTSMIKRPILKTATGYIAGFDEATYQALSTQ